MTDTAYDDPTMPSEEARKWATIGHISALIGLIGNGVGFVLGPLIVWLLQRHEDPYIDEQGKEALNFQLTWSLAALGLRNVVLPYSAALPAHPHRHIHDDHVDRGGCESQRGS